MTQNKVLDVAASDRKVKRAKLVSEIMTGLVVLSCFCSVILVMTMYQMGSRFTVLSQLFNTTIRGTENMFYSDVLDTRVEDARFLEWAFVQKFVEEKVFSIPDQKEMFRRWGVYGNRTMMARNKSNGKTPPVWTPVYKDSDDRLKNIEMTLPVHAENIRYISHIGHNWTVTYDECTEQKDGEAVVCHPRQVNVEVRFDPRRKQFRPVSGIYYNPFGMVIYEWQETKLGS